MKMETKNLCLLIVSLIVLAVRAESPSNSLDSSFSSTTTSPNRQSVSFSWADELDFTSPDYVDSLDNRTDSSLIKWPSDFLALNYTSLTKIIKECPQAPDHCHNHSKRPRESDDLDCSCEKDCKSLGNCCIDSDELSKAVQIGSNDELQFVEQLEKFKAFKEPSFCKELRYSNTSMFLRVRSECPADFSNKLIREKCEKQTTSTQFDVDERDPFSTVPVTSTKSRITYSNIYCALCNEYRHNLVDAYAGLVKDQASDLRLWRMNVSCDNLSIQNVTQDQNIALQDFISRHISFDEKISAWSIEYTDKNGTLTRKGCEMHVHMPEDLQFFAKPCNPTLIDYCPSHWPTNTLEGRKVDALCSAYRSRVNHQDKKQEYANVHCALCNFVDISRLGCPSNLLNVSANADLLPRAYTSLSSFNALFDVNYLIGNTNLVGKKVLSYCPDDAIYDPIFQKCRSLICGFNQEFFRGECRVPAVTYENVKPTEDLTNNGGSMKKYEAELIPTEESSDSSANQTESSLFVENEVISPPANQSDDQAAASQFSAEFRKCAKISLMPGTYMELKNDSVYITQYELLLNKGNYNLTDSQLLICVPFSPLLDKFENHYSAVAYVCLVFSIICLTLYLLLSCLVPDLRNLSGKNLSSLCFSLIMVYLCFAIAPFKGIQGDPLFCKLIAFVKYYGLLASFCWTGVIAFDIYQTIRNSLSSFRYKTGPQTARFLTYSLICWTLPLFAAVLAFLTDIGQFNQSIPDEFRPNFGQTKECWFGYRKSLLAFFVLPVGVITVLNLIFFLLTSKSLLLTTNRNKLKLSGTSASKFDFNLYLRLFLLMGLTWMTGFLATYFDNIYLWYLFTLFNTLQGVFIFFAFGCKAAVMKKLKMRLAKLLLLDKFSQNKNSSVSTTTTCRTPTNQSTITHLNSSDLCGDSYKVKDLLFSNKLADRSLGSLSKSLTELYAKNFYSTESINKSHLNQMTNDYYQPAVPGQQFQQPPTSLPLHRQLPNSSSTFGTIDHRLSTIENPNRSSTSSFKYPTDSPQANYSHINSQMNKWFDF